MLACPVVISIHHAKHALTRILVLSVGSVTKPKLMVVDVSIVLTLMQNVLLAPVISFVLSVCLTIS